jgi:glycosyltransferase involved in cell wall biosynthesis
VTRVLAAGVGLTHYYNQLLDRLHVDLGAQVDVVAAAGDGGHAGEGVFQTEQAVSFRIHRSKEWSIPGYYRSFRGLAGLIRKLSPHIVIAGAEHLAAFALDPLIRLALRQTAAKLLIKSIPFRLPRKSEALAAAGSGLQGLSRRALVGLRGVTFRAADAHVLHVAEGVGIYTSWGVPRERIFVAGNSPDTDLLFRAREAIALEKPILPANPHRIIHVGRLIPWKRVDLLIDALVKVRGRFPRAELLVVGEGPERARLEARALSAGLGEAVRFEGGVYEPERLGRYLLASSVYVLAGMGGLSINDAMCFGKPVVCSICDGTEKLLVREGENGSYFAEGNAESLAAAIARVLEDPERCRAMGERSTGIIRDEVNIHSVVSVYRQAFAFLGAPS